LGDFLKGVLFCLLFSLSLGRVPWRGRLPRRLPWARHQRHSRNGPPHPARLCAGERGRDPPLRSGSRQPHTGTERVWAHVAATAPDAAGHILSALSSSSSLCLCFLFFRALLSCPLLKRSVPLSSYCFMFYSRCLFECITTIALFSFHSISCSL